MDSTTKDELKIKTSIWNEDRPRSRLKTKEEIESEMIRIPQSMLRTPEIKGENMKEEEKELQKLINEIKNALLLIYEACAEAIQYLNDEEIASASFEIGQISAVCTYMTSKIEGDDE